MFKAIADGTRRIILDELKERDGQTLFELCGRLATRHGSSSSRQAISQHLEVLESAGWSRPDATAAKFHHINTDPLRPIVSRWLESSDQEGG